MEDYKVNGIVLSARDYSEKDKLITLFTLEFGKITAKLKGVKSAKAKLKYAGQPFCFGEWVLTKTGENYTVVSCSIIDTFYELTADYDLMLCATKLLKLVNIVFKSGLINEKLFINLINALKLILYDSCENDLILVKFYVDFLNMCGYGVDFSHCSRCGKQFLNDVYLDIKTGGVVCMHCSNNETDIYLSKQEFAYMKLISTTELKKINTIKIQNEILTQIKGLIEKKIKNVFDIDIV